MPHILIVESRFYEDIADWLYEGAAATLTKAGATFERISVPGAFEIPGAIRFALESKKYDGFIALGCVIQGDTSHYDYVCMESARGLTELAVHYKAALGYGILTTYTEEQARVRAHVGCQNKGRDAANACLRMVALKSQFCNE